MLIGHYETNISEKRRVAIPKKFRDELGQRLIIAKWYDGCLVLISESMWEGLVNKITGQTNFVTAPVRDTDRFIMGSAFEVVPDGQGRVIVPEDLSQYAGLNSNVYFVGLSDRVEVWDKETWKKREEFVVEHSGEFIETIANYQKGGSNK